MTFHLFSIAMISLLVMPVMINIVDTLQTRLKLSAVYSTKMTKEWKQKHERTFVFINLDRP